MIYYIPKSSSGKNTKTDFLKTEVSKQKESKKRKSQRSKLYSGMIPK